MKKFLFAILMQKYTTFLYLQHFFENIYTKTIILRDFQNYLTYLIKKVVFFREKYDIFVSFYGYTQN